MRSLWVGALVVQLVAGVLGYEEYAESEDYDVDFSDLDEDEDVPTTAALPISHTDSHSRLKRFGEQSSGARTLSLDEIREVKGAIKELFAGRQLDHLISTHAEDRAPAYTTKTEMLTKNPLFTGLTSGLSVDPTKLYDDFIEQLIDNAKKQGSVANEQKKRRIYTEKGDVTPTRTKSKTKPQRTSRTTTRKEVDEARRYLYELYEDTPEGERNVLRADTNLTSTSTRTTTSNPATGTATADQTATTGGILLNQTTTSQTTKLTTTAGPLIDIPALIDIIANLTSDIESNITRLFNETLQKYNIPTCKTPTTPTTEKIFYDLVNATVVSKCFVCGLEDTGIPSNSHCADAFAGDFLPLVPTDPQARGHIASFRKYCRYMDINGVYVNSSQPRSLYGRFTGGCSVRWIDLSGIYTQRACRNTRHAVTGRHFGSKRMAKLEMALNEVDNGCIISPMASLVPLSRGVSLYARFHACVCTGNWCNTSPTQPWTAYVVILTFLAIVVRST